MLEETVMGTIEADEWFPVAAFHTQEKARHPKEAIEFPKELVERFQAAEEAFIKAEVELVGYWEQKTGYRFQ
jgi:hypothetical protein